MSHGPGGIEREITELFRRSQRWISLSSSKPGLDRTWTADELAAAIYRTRQATRSQRLSVKRAVRSAIRRVRAVNRAASKLEHEAHAAAVANYGREPRSSDYLAFHVLCKEHPAGIAAAKLRAKIKHVEHLLHWRETLRADGVMVFHEYSHPVRIWAVTVARSGLVWAEAEIEELTDLRVSVRYQGVRCPLDRSKVAVTGAWWRGVCFVSEQDGYLARRFWQRWQDQFGHLEPLRLPFDQARQLLGVVEGYTRGDVIRAFRKLALKLHPDHGGDAEAFRRLVEARDLLLNMIGSKAEPVEVPKPATFVPSGARVVYRVWRGSGPRRIGGGGRRLLA